MLYNHSDDCSAIHLAAKPSTSSRESNRSLRQRPSAQPVVLCSLNTLGLWVGPHSDGALRPHWQAVGGVRREAGQGGSLPVHTQGPSVVLLADDQAVKVHSSHRRPFDQQDRRPFHDDRHYGDGEGCCRGTRVRCFRMIGIDLWIKSANAKKTQGVTLTNRTASQRKRTHPCCGPWGPSSSFDFLLSL